MGIPWFVVQKKILGCLPQSMSDREDLALQLVSEVISEVAGDQGVDWDKERRPRKDDQTKTIVWIKRLKKS
jgi:hypothetical protein